MINEPMLMHTDCTHAARLGVGVYRGVWRTQVLHMHRHRIRCGAIVLLQSFFFLGHVYDGDDRRDDCGL